MKCIRIFVGYTCRHADNLNVTFCTSDANTTSRVDRKGRKKRYRYLLNARTYAMHTAWQRKIVPPTEGTERVTSFSSSIRRVFRIALFFLSILPVAALLAFVHRRLIFANRTYSHIRFRMHYRKSRHAKMDNFRISRKQTHWPWFFSSFFPFCSMVCVCVLCTLLCALPLFCVSHSSSGWFFLLICAYPCSSRQLFMSVCMLRCMLARALVCVNAKSMLCIVCVQCVAEIRIHCFMSARWEIRLAKLDFQYVCLEKIHTRTVDGTRYINGLDQ